MSLEKKLKNQSKEHLVEWLCILAERSELVEQELNFLLENQSGQFDVKKSRALIKKVLKQYQERGGFIPRGKVAAAIGGAERVSELAAKKWAEGFYLNALELYLCVIGEMIDAIQFADDSYGEIGYIMRANFQRLFDGIDDVSGLPEEEQIAQRLLQESKKSRYSEWSDWQVELIEISALLTTTTKQRNRLELEVTKLLESNSEDDWSERYLIQQLTVNRYQMMRRFGEHEKAQAFLEQHIHLPDIRELILDEALEEENYQKVIEVAKQGETQHSQERAPGLVTKWKTYRFKAYQALGETEELQKLGTELVLNGDIEFYNKLKSLYSDDEWPVKYEQLIQQLEGKRIYTDILIEENDLVRLMQHVQANPSLVAFHYPHLLDHYPEQVKTLYQEFIRENAYIANNRKQYRSVVKLIRNLEKLGGAEEAAQVRDELIAEYNRKPAFVDELGEV
ncbi:hypothetical protein [Alkalicoccobacillus plakortidis]|uniref:Uncharacterized protein n=1 Tax=Alkalicoccobacillus plakortidis TaxID=444060 RepID=A0ABT0XJH3_9BACI|nr:hypothetical protein [Alkalicoccobacillus plakortidis]MCM2675880.1 hypothetical protein [Alkalicoccobacillus plakortidis]